MAPSKMLGKAFDIESHKCDLPFLDPEGNVVFFDVQSAEPGTFTVPGVTDLEVYEPSSFVETSWIFFKGDPIAGPQPGHPFEMPFNNSVKFSIDIVKDNDTSKVVHQLMPPTNSTLFWEGGAPFGRNANHSMLIPRLDGSCKYYSIAQMLYRWSVPNDIEKDSVLLLKLITDEPSTTHLSGKLRISNAEAVSSLSFGAVDRLSNFEDLSGHMVSFGLAGLTLVLLTSWIILRLSRRSGRIALE